MRAPPINSMSRPSVNEARTPRTSVPPTMPTIKITICLVIGIPPYLLVVLLAANAIVAHYCACLPLGIRTASAAGVAPDNEAGAPDTRAREPQQVRRDRAPERATRQALRTPALWKPMARSRRLPTRPPWHHPSNHAKPPAGPAPAPGTPVWELLQIVLELHRVRAVPDRLPEHDFQFSRIHSRGTRSQPRPGLVPAGQRLDPAGHPDIPSTMPGAPIANSESPTVSADRTDRPRRKGRSLRPASPAGSAAARPGFRPSPSSTTGPLQPQTRTVQPKPPRVLHSDRAAYRAPAAESNDSAQPTAVLLASWSAAYAPQQANVSTSDHLAPRSRNTAACAVCGSVVVHRPAVPVALPLVDRRCAHWSLPPGRHRHPQGNADNEPRPDKALSASLFDSGPTSRPDRSSRCLLQPSVVFAHSSRDAGEHLSHQSIVSVNLYWRCLFDSFTNNFDALQRDNDYNAYDSRELAVTYY